MLTNSFALRICIALYLFENQNTFYASFFIICNLLLLFYMLCLLNFIIINLIMKKIITSKRKILNNITCIFFRHNLVIEVFINHFIKTTIINLLKTLNASEIQAWTYHCSFAL